MKWVKASERLPDTAGIYFVRMIDKKETRFFDLTAMFRKKWQRSVFEWLDESEPRESKTKRYFHISYRCETPNKTYTGSIWFASDHLWSNKKVKQEIAKMSPFMPESEMVITGIFEFKSEQDFISWNS